MAKSAIEKLNIDKQPKIIRDFPADATGWAANVDSMVVSTPKEVDSLMKIIPKGKLTSIADIRHCLAKKYKVDIACPISTGIFINIAARAAEEMLQLGQTEITPYWRTLKTDGSLNEKYPGGVALQSDYLQAEGFDILEKGKKRFVKDYEKFLYRI